jgi:hypothetical protein
MEALAENKSLSPVGMWVWGNAARGELRMNNGSGQQTPRNPVTGSALADGASIGKVDRGIVWPVFSML